MDDTELPDPPPTEEEILALMNPRTYQVGASVLMRVGPMPEVTPILDTPSDWAESEAWTEWEPPLRAVAGEHHHAESLDSILEDGEGLFAYEAALVRDPDNAHDRNAIRVEVRNLLVGYIKKELAAGLAPVLDSAGCTHLSVPGVIYADAEGRQVCLWLRRRLSDGPELPIPVEFADANEATDPRYEPEPEGKPSEAEQVIQRFYDLNNDAAEAWSERDLDRLLANADEVFAMLDEYVAAAIGEDGQRRALLKDFDSSWVPSESFQPLTHIEAMSQAGPLLAALGRRDQLAAMRYQLAAVDPPARLLEEMDGFQELEQLCGRIVGFVSANPKVVQKDLYSLLGEDKTAVSTACWRLDLVGRIDRTKRGVSYELSVAASEPLDPGWEQALLPPAPPRQAEEPPPRTDSGDSVSPAYRPENRMRETSHPWLPDEVRSCRVCGEGFRVSNATGAVLDRCGGDAAAIDFCNPCMSATIPAFAQPRDDKTDSEITAWLQAVKEAIGRPPAQDFPSKKLLAQASREEREQVVRLCQDRPSIESVKALFGTWRNAVTTAG